MRRLMLAVPFIALALAIVFSRTAETRPGSVASYVTTVTELRQALDLTTDERLCVAVGRGYKCSPVRVQLRCMTPDTRADWYDNHSDGGCVWVVVLVETTRAETE